MLENRIFINLGQAETFEIVNIDDTTPSLVNVIISAFTLEAV